MYGFNLTLTALRWAKGLRYVVQLTGLISLLAAAGPALSQTLTQVTPLPNDTLAGCDSLLLKIEGQKTQGNVILDTVTYAKGPDTLTARLYYRSTPVPGNLAIEDTVQITQLDTGDYQLKATTLRDSNKVDSMMDADTLRVRPLTAGFEPDSGRYTYCAGESINITNQTTPALSHLTYTWRVNNVAIQSSPHFSLTVDTAAGFPLELLARTTTPGCRDSADTVFTVQADTGVNLRFDDYLRQAQWAPVVDSTVVQLSVAYETADEAGPYNDYSRSVITDTTIAYLLPQDTCDVHYAVTATAYYGECSSTLRDTSYWICPSRQPARQAAVRVSPNPASSQRQLELTGAMRYRRATLLDATGRRVQRWPLARQRKQTLPLRGVPQGVYLLRLRGEAGTLTRRVMVR
jgi:hypothetical protein